MQASCRRERALGLRSSSGSFAITSERTSSVLSIRGALTSIASIAPFPHTPHEDDV